MGQTCANTACQRSDTPMWRKGWTPTGSDKPVNLCNACGILYKRGWFCVWCDTVYRKEERDQLWLGCDYCEGWSHYRCELEHARGEVTGGPEPAERPEERGEALKLEVGQELDQLEQKCALALVDGIRGGGGGLHSADGGDANSGGGTGISSGNYRCPECRRCRQATLPPPRNHASNASQTSVAAGARVLEGRVVHHRPFLRTEDARSGGGGGGGCRGARGSKSARSAGVKSTGQKYLEEGVEEAKPTCLPVGAAAPSRARGKGTRPHQEKGGGNTKKRKSKQKALGTSKKRKAAEGGGGATAASAGEAMHSRGGGRLFSGGDESIERISSHRALLGRASIDWTLLRQQRSSRTLAAEAEVAAEVEAVNPTVFDSGMSGDIGSRTSNTTAPPLYHNFHDLAAAAAAAAASLFSDGGAPSPVCRGKPGWGWDSSPGPGNLHNLGHRGNSGGCVLYPCAAVGVPPSYAAATAAAANVTAIAERAAHSKRLKMAMGAMGAMRASDNIANSCPQGGSSAATSMGEQSDTGRGVVCGAGVGAPRLWEMPPGEIGGKSRPTDQLNVAPPPMTINKKTKTKTKMKMSNSTAAAAAAVATSTPPCGGGRFEGMGSSASGLRQLPPLNTLHSPHGPSIFTAARLSGMATTSTVERGSAPAAPVVPRGMDFGSSMAPAIPCGRAGGAFVPYVQTVRRGDAAAGVDELADCVTPASICLSRDMEVKHPAGGELPLVDPVEPEALEEEKKKEKEKEKEEEEEEEEEDLMEPDDMMVQADSRAEELRELARSLSGWADAEESMDEGAVCAVLSHLGLASSVTRELIRHTGVFEPVTRLQRSRNPRVRAAADALAGSPVWRDALVASPPAAAASTAAAPKTTAFRRPQLEPARAQEKEKEKEEEEEEEEEEEDCTGKQSDEEEDSLHLLSSGDEAVALAAARAAVVLQDTDRNVGRVDSINLDLTDGSDNLGTLVVRGGTTSEGQVATGEEALMPPAAPFWKFPMDVYPEVVSSASSSDPYSVAAPAAFPSPCWMGRMPLVNSHPTPSVAARFNPTVIADVAPCGPSPRGLAERLGLIAAGEVHARGREKEQRPVSEARQ